MYRIGKFRNGIVIILTSSDDIHYAVVKKGRVEKTGVCPFDKLNQIRNEYKLNRAVVGFLSELTYFDRTTFRIKNKKFLNLAVRRYLNEQAVFAEEFDFRFSVVDMKDVADVFICGVPRSDLHRIEAIKRLYVIEAVLPVEIAVLNYCKKTTSAGEAVFVFDNFRVDIGIKNGIISSRRLTPYEGEEFDYVDVCILRDDELFVALLSIDKNFDFLDRNYINEIFSFELSKLAFIFSLFFTVVVLGFAYQSYKSYKSLKAKFNARMSFYQSINRYINSSVPSEETKTNLKKIDDLIKLENKQLNLPGLLNFITAIIPSPFKLEEISVSTSPKKENNQSAHEASKTNTIKGNSLYGIKILISCSCSYGESKRLIKRFIGKLSDKVEKLKADLDYTDKDNLAKFRCSFKVNGEKF